MQKSEINDQISPIASTPWWVYVGSQDEQQVNSSNLNQFSGVVCSNLVKSQQIMGQVPYKDKEAVFQPSFTAGDNKNSLKENNMHNHQTNIFQHFSSTQQKGSFELGLGQPVVYANYPLVDQCHGVFTAYTTQPMGQGRLMVPFSLETEDGHIFVNPKQYHGILRRRKIRAKEGITTRATRDKPYLHESRHRHACGRPRGAGGRFLNSKNVDKESTNKTSKDHHQQQTIFLASSNESSSSEVVQSESVNMMNSSREFSHNCKSPTFLALW